MVVATAILVLAAFGLGLFAYRREKAVAWEGVRRGGKVLARQAPLLIFAFILAGYLEVLLPPELVHYWLGDEAGFRGVVLGSLVGGMIPSGPYVAYPIIAAMQQAGAGLATAVAFITGWMLWSTSRLPFELAIFGPKFTLVRYSLYLLFPPLAGGLVLFLWS